MFGKQRCVASLFWAPFGVAWENSRRLATLLVVSSPNDMWETSAEIPYWRRVTTQILVLLLIGCPAWEIWFSQSEARPRSGKWCVISYGICALVSQTSLARKPVHGSVAKCQLFSQATFECRTQWLTRIDFQISFNPDWQIDDGFLKGQSWNEITLMTLNIYSSLERERVFS